MPTKPLPGQKKPPCDPEAQRVINGACWVVAARKKPLCGSESFGYEEASYLLLLTNPPDADLTT